MQKFVITVLSVLVFFGLKTQPANAIYQSLPPTKAERDAALKISKGFSFVLRGLTGKSFIRKGTHWEATGRTKTGQEVTIVVYKQINTREVRNVEKIRAKIDAGGELDEKELNVKGLVNIAFTAPTAKLGNLIAAANQGEFGKIELRNATTFIISPNSPLGKKQGATEVATLPPPIARALKSINPKMKEIKLPTGMFLINQFQPDTSSFTDLVFKEAGLTYPVVSFVSLNAGNYAKLLKGQAGLSLSIVLTKKNGIARLIELTQMFKTPRDGKPVITIAAGGGKGGVGSLSIAYKAPYLVLGKGPIKTSLKFAYNLKKRKISGDLTVGIGRIKNPVIVPKLIELEGVTFDGTEVAMGFAPGDTGMEVTGGLEIGKMTIKKKAFEPVRFTLAMTAAGPKGGLIEIKSDDTLYLGNIADLAEVAFNAHPTSRLVPKWARKDMSRKLQLHKLPEFGIRKPHLFLATPGQDDSNHAADFADIAGAGVRVKGELIAMGQRLTYTDLGLDIVNGLNALSYVKPFKAGIFELKGAELAIHASHKAVPYFKLHAGMEIENLNIGEADLEFGRKGMKVAIDSGCFSPMLKYKIATVGWTKITDKSIDASGCAKKLAVAIANAAREAGKWTSKATSDAGKWSAKAGQDAGKWASKAASDTAKFFKNAGCSIEDAFTGGKCSKKKDRAKRRKAKRKAEKAAAKYRRIANPGHCTNGWVWNHKYRKCWRPGSNMFFFTEDGGKTGRCLDISGAKHVNGRQMIIWDCHGSWNQQFRFVKFNPKLKNDPFVRIMTTGNKCLSADTRKKKVLGMPLIMWTCDSNPGQKWRFVGGRLIGLGNLCLRATQGNKKGSGVSLRKCDENPKISQLEQQLLKLKTTKRKLLKNPPTKTVKKVVKKGPFAPKQIKTAKKVDRKKFDKMKTKLDGQIRAKNKQLDTLRRNPPKSKKANVEWVSLKPSNNPVTTFHKRYNVPSMGMLRVSAGNYCLDKTSGMLPRARPHLWKCSKKNGNQKFGIGSIKGQYFALVSQRSKMCMDVRGAKKVHGGSVIQYPCHYRANQQWFAVSPGKKSTDSKTFSGRFLIKNRNSGKCLAAIKHSYERIFSRRDKQMLSKMRANQKKRCEELYKRNKNPLVHSFQHQYRHCPKGRMGLVIKTQTRKKARFAQVNCNSGDRNQLFSLIR